MMTIHFNFRYTSNHAWQHLLLPCMTALCLLVSCSSDNVIEEIEEIKASNDPMKFTCNIQDNPSATRASQSLTSDFLVSTYKAFGSSGQQIVMDEYIVKHSTSGSDWDGNTSHNWDYTNIDGQIERYWDYNSFPYRFNAVAPAASQTIDKSKITLSDKNLLINVPYKMQTCKDGAVTPALSEAEPYLVAQVQRATDGTDIDIYADTQIGDENSSKTLSRYVALPFHHLNSKIRFAIFTTSPWATANPMYIKDLKIEATSANFVTQAAKYSIADKANSWLVSTGNSGFAELTKSNTTTDSKTTLFEFTGGKDVTDNDLSLHQGVSSAYWLLCASGMTEIPQENVEMEVSLSLYRRDNDNPVKTFNNVSVKLIREDKTEQTTFKWQSGYIYTYYLIIDNIGEKLEITFTATLAPWEDISGSLSTDLEK